MENTIIKNKQSESVKASSDNKTLSSMTNEELRSQIDGLVQLLFKEYTPSNQT